MDFAPLTIHHHVTPSGDDDHAPIRFDPHTAARIDDHGIGRRRRGQRQGFLGAHAAEQEADTFGSASPRRKSSSIQAAVPWRPKKPDRYWSAPARPSAAIPPGASRFRQRQIARTDRANARATSDCWAKPDSTKNTLA